MRVEKVMKKLIEDPYEGLRRWEAAEKAQREGR